MRLLAGGDGTALPTGPLGGTAPPPGPAAVRLPVAFAPGGGGWGGGAAGEGVGGVPGGPGGGRGAVPGGEDLSEEGHSVQKGYSAVSEGYSVQKGFAVQEGNAVQKGYSEVSEGYSVQKGFAVQEGYAVQKGDFSTRSGRRMAQVPVGIEGLPTKSARLQTFRADFVIDFTGCLVFLLSFSLDFRYFFAACLTL